ncbi:hypothetical protein O1R50_18810 [Glycomyces luteolus]|uniref:Uncharacterized protein n=1 Tax=Glycomyces luteolus TaxID=2670330 RepID=A0A9X3PA90_9ACTN|nr:hypothetical protein [Glycomyces luteolus]MDA1361686.1 hypothetical protein [Glycomyces luteolus]
MIASFSPIYRAPRKGWGITPIGDRRPAPNGGTLDLRVGWCEGRWLITDPAKRLQIALDREQSGDPVASDGFLRSSLVPVALVDGEPVATGWGRIRIPLAAGRHLVEVQSQHSRAWRAVDVTAGGTAKIDYIGMLGESHRAYGDTEVPYGLRDIHGYTIGPRGRLNYFQYLPAHARQRLGFSASLLGAVAVGVVALTLTLVGLPLEAAMVAWWSLTAAGFAVWGIRVFWTFLRCNRLGPEPPLLLRGTAVLDEDGPLPELGTGAGILIDARFLKADLASDELALQLPEGQQRINGAQRKSLDAVGELVPIRHRYTVPPPEILVDGVPLGAYWTRMWLEVPPGAHRLEVRTPGPPLPVEGEEHPPHTAAATVNLEAGQVARIDLVATVTAVPDPLRPVLHLWHCRIDRLGPQTDREAPAAPRADVRGGLRRAVTGRYWETRDDIPPKQ